MNDTTSSAPVDIAFDDAFDSWLEGSAIAQRSEVIYGKPQLFAQFQDLERRMKALEVANKEEGSQADPEMDDLVAEYQGVYDQWMASKSTWFLHGLSEDDRDKIRDETPVFDDLPKDAPHGEKSKRDRELQATQRDMNIRTIAAAVVRIELGTGKTIDKVTPAQVKAMAGKIGPHSVLKLMTAVALASNDEAEIPAPLSRKKSESAQD